MMRKVLIIAGQNEANALTKRYLESCCKKHGMVLIADVISNLSSVEVSICHQDLFLGVIDDATKRNLQPDLVISFGKSVISGNIKAFLRKYKPKAHWHISENTLVPDTFQSLTSHYKLEPAAFLSVFEGLQPANTLAYDKLWRDLDSKTNQFLKSQRSGFWEFSMVIDLMEKLPPHTQLHLANSMPVRWVNFINTRREDIEIFANRGTNGIDGCLSTAVGCALGTKQPVIVILGDMSFLYDRNGLWHNNLPANLRIMVFNNAGGGIFRLIDGPSEQPEIDRFFVTTQRLKAKNTVLDFDLDYMEAANLNTYQKVLPLFLESNGRGKLLEIITNSHVNQEKFKKLKVQLKKHLNH